MTLVTLAAVAALATPHGAAAQVEVEQAFTAFKPPVIDIVTGDRVRWRNASLRPHTVSAGDGTFDSGRMSPGQTYTRAFGARGTSPYHCRLHAGMTGEVRVHDVLLRPPPAPTGPGRPFPLHGRTLAHPGSAVTVEGDAGAGFAPVAQAMPDADGSFAVVVRPQHSTSYRAVADGQVSPPVRLLVLDRTVTATARRDGRRLTVSARVTPASPGETVVLQLHLRRRFGWWPVRRARLDGRSRATFRMSLRHAPPARVVLTLPDGATALARSAPLRTR